MKRPTPAEIRDDLDDIETFVADACERLDALLGENTLTAVVDGTIDEKLHEYLLDDHDWDMMAGASLISSFARDMGDPDIMRYELIHNLFCLAQFFRFCGARITETWALDQHCIGVSPELDALGDPDYGAAVSLAARALDMNDEEIMALLEYLSPENLGKDQ